MNWRAKPLVSYQVIIDLIGATTTKTGLKVICELDNAHWTNPRSGSRVSLRPHSATTSVLTATGVDWIIQRCVL